MDKALDASTITKKNFKVAAADEYSSAVSEVMYFPKDRELRIYLENVPEYDLLPSYQLTATGLKDTDGNKVSINETVSVTAEEECPLYDVSVLSLTYTKDGKTYYKQPEEGNFIANISVINTSKKTSKIEISICAKNEEGNIREICTEEVTLDSDRVFENSYSIEILSGETICVNTKII